MNLAELTKRMRDAAFNQQSIDPGKTVVISTPTPSSGGSGQVVNPTADLTRHKGSGDHDSRYYTQAEVDALLGNAGRYWEPLTNGDIVTPELILYNGDIVMAEVI